MRARSLHGRRRVAATVVGLLAASATPLGAQSGSQTTTQSGDVVPGVIYACYVPYVGLLYVIKEPQLLLSCLDVPVQHPEISWNRQGPKGDKGPAGAAGPPGADGTAGDKGPPGPAGSQGPVGDQGPPGDKGASGAAGAVGDKGPTGDNGPDGPAGALGDKGPTGDAGVAGTQGLAGDKGPTGNPGSAGEKGATGEQGPIGGHGAPGDAGAQGPQGPAGDKGPEGDIGPTGDKGLTGEEGSPGTLPCDACVTTPMIADLAVTDARLATISAPGKIANTATTATSANLANRIVARNAAGSLAAATVTMATLRLNAAGQIVHGSRLLQRVGGSLPRDASVYLGFAAGPPPPRSPAGNVGVGAGAMVLTWEDQNTGLGLDVMNVSTPSVGNTVLGQEAMDDLTANGGRHNVVVGFRAARFLAGRRNIILGSGAGGAMTGASNEIQIAAGPAEASAVRVGTTGTHLRAFVAGIENTTVTSLPVHVNTSTGQLGVFTSSARFKLGVQDIGDASAALHRLRPVSYRYRPDLDPRETLHYGLIAEEVDRVAPGLVVRDSTARPYTVRYEMLVPLLVDEIQRRDARLAALRQESAALLRRLERLEVAAKPWGQR